jgi:hypothetical protein
VNPDRTSPMIMGNLMQNFGASLKILAHHLPPRDLGVGGATSMPGVTSTQRCGLDRLE